MFFLRFFILVLLITSGNFLQISRTTADAYSFANRQGGSIFIVLAGCALAKVENLEEIQLSRGSVFFAPATSKLISFKVVGDKSDGDFVAYQAMYNDFD